MTPSRPATADDFPAIAALNVAAYEEFAPHLAPEAWAAMRANLTAVAQVAERATFLVVRVGEELIGSVAYCPAGRSDPAIFPPDWASALLLAVRPDCRGRGLARALVVDCLEQARANGATVVGLYTSELMGAARRLYEEMGFRTDKELPQRHGLRYWRYRLDLVGSVWQQPR